ncbi:MAG: hypothetical protein E7616_07505 [Ruminococcaceae bacterium]|nr:hypothetical protein [Oscillospiraceae bacterium]
MKKIIAFILCILTLIPLLLSCGGQMPEKTPEPATPETVTPEEMPTPEPEPVILPFEGGSFLGGVIFGLNEKTVIEFDSKEKLSHYMQMLDNEIQVLSEYLAQDSITPTNIMQHMRAVAELQKIKNTLNRYYKDSFFEDNVLVWFTTGLTDVIINNVSVCEADGKKQLRVDATHVRSTQFSGDGESWHIMYLAIPRDHGVDLTKDVVFNWKYVLNSLYYPEIKE